MRRRVTRRLTRFQTKHNVLKIAIHFKTVAVRLRLIFQFTNVQYCNPTLGTLYLLSSSLQHVKVRLRMCRGDAGRTYDVSRE